MAPYYLCLLWVAVLVGTCSSSPVPASPRQEDADPTFSAAWAVAAGISLVAIVAMCIHAEPALPQPYSAPPDGAIETVPPFESNMSRARIATPAKGPTAPGTAPATDYGEIIRSSAPAQPGPGPGPGAGPGKAEQAFIREIVNGQLAYRPVRLDQVDALIAEGHQVFRPSNRQDAGQDIYETVETSTDLYASVPSKASDAAASSPADMDLYAAPNKTPAAPAAPAAPAGAPAASLPIMRAQSNDYEPEGPVGVWNSACWKHGVMVVCSADVRNPQPALADASRATQAWLH